MKKKDRLTYSQKKAGTLLFTCLGLATLMGCNGALPIDASAEVISSAESIERVEESVTPKTEQEDKPAKSAFNSAGDVDSRPTSQTNVAVAAPVDIAAGMTYADARSRLMQQGWLPIEGPEPGSYGAERTLYDAGFTEVSACSGSGAGACSFSFYHPDRSAADGDNGLDITTYGGSSPEIAEWGTFAFTDTASGSASTGGQQQALIPVQFHDEWSALLDKCSKPFNDGQLVIDPDQLVFYESVGPVLDVVVNGESDITVTTELSSEGTSYENTYNFRLSDDTSTLTESTYGSVWYRCPDI